MQGTRRGGQDGNRGLPPAARCQAERLPRCAMPPLLLLRCCRSSLLLPHLLWRGRDFQQARLQGEHARAVH